MTDDPHELARESMRKMFAAAKSRKELAWLEIQSGCNPAFVALKYGLPLADMLRAKLVHEERQERVVKRRQPNDN